MVLRLLQNSFVFPKGVLSVICTCCSTQNLAEDSHVVDLIVGNLCGVLPG